MRGLSAPGVVKKLSNILRKQHFDADVSDAEDPPRQFGQCPKERVFVSGRTSLNYWTKLISEAISFY